MTIKHPRFCKYVFCKKLLPKNTPTLKKYCLGTDCYSKQNSIAAKERRDIARTKKPKKFKVCNFDECKKRFEVPAKSPLRESCSDECRDARKRKVQNISKATIAKEKTVRKEEAIKIEKKVDKLRDSGIEQCFLERGNISNGNTAWAGNVNA